MLGVPDAVGACYALVKQSVSTIDLRRTDRLFCVRRCLCVTRTPTNRRPHNPTRDAELMSFLPSLYTAGTSSRPMGIGFRGAESKTSRLCQRVCCTAGRSLSAPSAHRTNKHLIARLPAVHQLLSTTWTKLERFRLWPPSPPSLPFLSDPTNLQFNVFVPDMRTCHHPVVAVGTAVTGVDRLQRYVLHIPNCCYLHP